MSRRTLVIVAAAIVGLGAVALILWAILNTGGTPIIIKGFGDDEGGTGVLASKHMTIDGSPKKVGTTQGKDDHTGTDRIEQVYIKQDLICWSYEFPKDFQPTVTVGVGNANQAIELTPASSPARFSLRFDENAYDKDSKGKYKTKQPAAIKKVNVSIRNDVNCKNHTGITVPCLPELEFKNGEITIAVNYGLCPKP